MGHANEVAKVKDSIVLPKKTHAQLRWDSFLQTYYQNYYMQIEYVVKVNPKFY